jgi:uncharacterized protein (UPF0333 family)
VEFALVAPVLLLLVFGILQFGLVLNAQLALTEGVREAAQLAAMGDPQATAQAAVAANAPMVQGLNVAVTTSGNEVTVVASGSYPVLVPLPVTGSSIALSASMTEVADGAPGG